MRKFGLRNRFKGGIVLNTRIIECAKWIKETYFPKSHKFKVFKEKPKLFIWFIVSFSFMWSYLPNAYGFILTCIFYYILINIALSYKVERIIRYLEDVRHLAMREEKERIFPLWYEVYERAKEKSENIGTEIELFVVDIMSVNAFAIGAHTIVITRGLMETMDDEEIKGILAHEFAHIANYDTQLKLIITFASTLYLWVVIFVQCLLMFIKGISGSDTTHSITDFLESIVQIFISLTIVVWTAIISKGERTQEYIADTYACQLGYTEQLKSALKKLYKIQLSDKRKIIERLQATHPRLAYRIERLEDF